MSFHHQQHERRDHKKVLRREDSKRRVGSNNQGRTAREGIETTYRRFPDTSLQLDIELELKMGAIQTTRVRTADIRDHDGVGQG